MMINFRSDILFVPDTDKLCNIASIFFLYLFFFHLFFCFDFGLGAFFFFIVLRTVNVRSTLLIGF